jgi:hypothetical protein
MHIYYIVNSNMATKTRIGITHELETGKKCKMDLVETELTNDPQIIIYSKSDRKYKDNNISYKPKYILNRFKECEMVSAV